MKVKYKVLTLFFAFSIFAFLGENNNNILGNTSVKAVSSSTYTISGQLTNRDGEPIEGIEIQLTDETEDYLLFIPLIITSGTATSVNKPADVSFSPLAVTILMSTTTDINGEFTFSGLEEGDYVVVPVEEDRDFNPQSFDVSVPPDATDVSFDRVCTTDFYNMIEIPSGLFRMGCDPATEGSCNNPDETPLHWVNLATFYIDKYEVSNSHYSNCVAAGACTVPSSLNSYTRTPYYGNSTYNGYPVINVSWYQAVDYCTWKDKRLPTEAEWEKAARGASDTRPYPWGVGDPNCTLLNYEHGTPPSTYMCVGDTNQTVSYPTGASPYGVFNMSGNVWEWVNDWYQSDYYSFSPSSNPKGPAAGTAKVLRGNGFNTALGRLAIRYGYASPDFSYMVFGFRCAAYPP